MVIQILKSLLGKQLCCIQTKCKDCVEKKTQMVIFLSKLYRPDIFCLDMTFCSFFYKIDTLYLGVAFSFKLSNLKHCYNEMRVNTLGKFFSRGHFEILFLFFLENRI